MFKSRLHTKQIGELTLMIERLQADAKASKESFDTLTFLYQDEMEKTRQRLSAIEGAAAVQSPVKKTKNK